MFEGHYIEGQAGNRQRAFGRYGRRSDLPVGVLLVLFLMMAQCPAQFTPPSEQQVKAAIVVNLPKYVEWPDRAFAAPNSPIVLGVAAPPHLETELRTMTANKAVGPRKLELRRIESGANDQPLPHILFVSGMDAKPAAELLLKCQGRPVLTVVDGAINKLEGGIITLTRKDNKVRLEIDVAAAKDAQLTISSKLLGVADAVKGRDK